MDWQRNSPRRFSLPSFHCACLPLHLPCQTKKKRFHAQHSKIVLPDLLAIDRSMALAYKTTRLGAHLLSHSFQAVQRADSVWVVFPKPLHTDLQGPLQQRDRLRELLLWTCEIQGNGVDSQHANGDVGKTRGKAPILASHGKTGWRTR